MSDVSVTRSGRVLQFLLFGIAWLAHHRPVVMTAGRRAWLEDQSLALEQHLDELARPVGAEIASGRDTRNLGQRVLRADMRIEAGRGVVTMSGGIGPVTPAARRAAMSVLTRSISLPFSGPRLEPLEEAAL